MMDNQPALRAVVIDNGLHTTRAGLLLDELPLAVFPTCYLRGGEAGPVVGDSLMSYPMNDVYTVMKGGVVYNWEHVEANWRYAYEKMGVELLEGPLVMTENAWNPANARMKTAEVAFELLEVPLFALVKLPLCVTYGLGKLTALVIDVGASLTSVTPVVDGLVVAKGVRHLRFAGDFLLLHAMSHLAQLPAVGGAKGLVPRRYAGVAMLPLFENYVVGSTLHDFKASIATVHNLPVQPAQTVPVAPKHFQLPLREIVEFGAEQFHLGETLFQPAAYPLPAPYTVNKEEDGVRALGLTELVLALLKGCEIGGDIYGQLLSNLVITGGTSLLPGLQARLLADLSRFLPNFPLYYYTTLGLSGLERRFGGWIGALCLVLIGDGTEGVSGLFVSKQEYLEVGDGIIERFK